MIWSVRPRVVAAVMVVSAIAVVAYFTRDIALHPLATFLYNHLPATLRRVVKYRNGTSADQWLQIQNHVHVSALAVALAGAMCVPAGIISSRIRAVSIVASNLVGVLRVVPSLAVVFLMVPWLGLGFTPALVALVILACPPIFINTTVGFSGVDKSIVEAARGMGMNAAQVLVRVETPLALPVMLAGFRTAAVEVIASATLAAFIGYETLGRDIQKGLDYFFSSDGLSSLLLGGITIAVLALIAEIGFSLLQRVFTPPAA